MPVTFRRVHTISVDQKVVFSPSHICNNSLNTVNSNDPNRVHILWISYFTDKFQWYDISNTKICSKSPDFKHKITKDFLWVDAWYIPSWVTQELKRGRGKDTNTVGIDNNECVAIVDFLKDCAIRKDLCKGSQAHVDILKKGLFEKSPYVGSTLVSMYAKCGALEKAKKVLKNLPIRNVISWSALISGYAQHGHGEEALDCFETMKSEGFSPDAITFTSVLNACATMKFLDKGIDIHDEIVGKRLLGKHISLDNALIDMYAKCGALEKAQKVLDELHSRDVVSWSTLIAGFAHHGRGEEALLCYKLMQSDGISPNVVTWICVLKACGGLKALDKGKRIHNEIEKKASITGEDTVLGNALVDMYAKCDAIPEARHSLYKLRGRDVVSWSSLIAGYIQQGQNEDALMCFKEMKIEGLCPDAITFSYILKACGSVGAIDKGKEVHDEVENKGILRSDTTLGTALVDMYAKCGALGRARKVLNELSERNVAMWNALISGYAQHGQGEEALECFRQMLHDGMSPDAITYVCLLNACTHSALVDEGQMCFAEMIKSYDITPNPEHYACMVNLFSRVGHFEKATDIITKMPSSDYRPVWSALLGSCQNWGNLNLGRLVFEHATQLDGNYSASYISLSNIYATASMHDECGKA